GGKPNPTHQPYCPTCNASAGVIPISHHSNHEPCLKYIPELLHGPTYAFKDVVLQLLRSLLLRLFSSRVVFASSIPFIIASTVMFGILFILMVIMHFRRDGKSF